MRAIRVLHLLSSTGFHGAEAMAAELIRHSAALGIEMHVGVFDNGGGGDRHIIEAVRGCSAGSAVLPCRRQLDPAAIAAIARYASTQCINIVHSHKYKTTFHALLARRRCSFKLVATYHNWLCDSAALRLYAAIDKRLARFCDAAVGVSGPVAAELARFAPAQRVLQIGNGVDLERFRPPASRAAARRALAGLGLGERPVIGFVGRLTAQKGVADLLNAVAEAGRSIACDVLIVGDGAARAALEAQAARTAGDTRVHFLGTRADTPPLYAAMDLLVLPSVVEAFPMVLLEAMASAVPVIGTPVGDVPRIVTAETGWLTPVSRPMELAALLVRALRDPAALELMGQRARRHVEAGFSAQRMAHSYLELYRELLGRGSRSQRDGRTADTVTA